VSAVDDPTIWSVLAAVGAFSSAMMLVAAEHHGAHAQAWLAASAFGLCSAVAAVCFFFWEAAA
jgi:hypothetical protein